MRSPTADPWMPAPDPPPPPAAADVVAGAGTPAAVVAVTSGGVAARAITSLTRRGSRRVPRSDLDRIETGGEPSDERWWKRRIVERRGGLLAVGVHPAQEVD